MNDMMFDYNQAAENAGIPHGLLARLVDEARTEFPWDEMLMELHVIRAINAYTAMANAKQAAAN